MDDQSEDLALKQEKVEVLKRFGKKLAEIRKEKGFTQEKLAFDIGVDRTYISYMERGKRNPSLFILWRLSRMLFTKLNELADF